MIAMKQKKMTVLVCLVTLLGITATKAFALMVAPAPLPVRVANSDSIVIGKVIGLEEKKEKGARFPGDKEGGDFIIATVKIETAYGNVTNVKKLNTVRVGFQAPPMVPPPGPAGPGIIRPGIRRIPTPQLIKDQQVCLFLTPDSQGNFYTIQAYTDVITKNPDAAEDFKNQTDEVKKLAKLLENSKASLESKDAKDRFLTAGMLIHRYRDRRGLTGEPVEEPIDANLSKPILNALVTADWNQNGPGPFQMTPLNVFFNLNLTPQDGWKNPKNGQNIMEEAQKWLKNNADKYRVKRLVDKKANNP